MARVGRKTTWLHRLNRRVLAYEYKHTTAAVLSVLFFVLVFDTAFMSSIFSYLNSLDYLGGLIAGALSATFITAAPALVLIVGLAQHLDSLALALIVGLGSAIGDMILLLFFEERIFQELAPLGRRLKLKRFISRRAGKRKRMSAPLLLAGAFVIMTPLPDEIGLGLLGISHFPKVFIFVLCLALNTLGASLLIMAARAVV
ncbi:MAG TPA: hypothetical protein VJM32_05325 [Candidatus Saccharimonadales bacterium]|nr:hypothetical protein [Candidatus Saccharimonadales bacterium]